jgi:hypothetical protein
MPIALQQIAALRTNRRVFMVVKAVKRQGFDGARRTLSRWEMSRVQYTPKVARRLCGGGAKRLVGKER